MDTARVKEYKAQIKNSFSRASRNHFVDWRHASYLASDLYEILSEVENEFSAHEDRWELFSIVNFLFLKWGKTNMDDSDGHTWTIVNECKKLWERILQACESDKEEKKMMLFFMKHSQGAVIDYMESDLLDFLDQHFKSPQQLIEKKEFYETCLCQISHPDQAENLSHYQIKQFRLYLLQIMADQGLSIDEIERQVDDNDDLSTQKRLLKIYQERGETEREIALLQTIIQRLSFHSHYCRAHQDRLKQIYLERGDQQSYVNLLNELIWQRVGDTNLLSEYKKLFSKEDWIKERDTRLFPSLEGREDAMPWFHAEGKWDLLMETAEKTKNLSSFEKDLMKRYPERGLQILVQNVLDQMDRAKDRRGYRYVARLMRKLKKYPSGATQVQSLAEQFCQQYPRRPALHDEMREFIHLQ